MTNPLSSVCGTGTVQTTDIDGLMRTDSLVWIECPPRPTPDEFFRPLRSRYCRRTPASVVWLKPMSLAKGKFEPGNDALDKRCRRSG